MSFDREQETTSYIAANWEKDDRLAIVLIDRTNGNRVTQRIKTAEEICAPTYQAHLRAANANGSDIFISMNSLKPEAIGRHKSDIAAVRHVYLDLDSSGSDSVKQILSDPNMPKPHHVLESSRGKFQAIWSVEGFTPREAEALMKTLVPVYQADPAATDSARVLRLPSFRNWKYREPHYVKDVMTGQAAKQEYTPADFPTFSQAQTQQIHQRATAGQDVGTGTRSHHDWAYVCRELEKGTNRATIEAELMARRTDKPNPKYYAEHTVDNAVRRLQAQGHAVGIG